MNRGRMRGQRLYLCLKCAGGEGAAMTELKIWTEVQRFEASDSFALQTQVAATVIRMLSLLHCQSSKDFLLFFFLFIF